MYFKRLIKEYEVLQEIETEKIMIQQEFKIIKLWEVKNYEI